MGRMTHDRWTLDPSRFPQRLDLDHSDQALSQLERLSARTGRSVGDPAADLLSQAINHHPLRRG